MWVSTCALVFSPLFKIYIGILFKNQCRSSNACLIQARWCEPHYVFSIIFRLLHILSSKCYFPFPVAAYCLSLLVLMSLISFLLWGQSPCLTVHVSSEWQILNNGVKTKAQIGREFDCQVNNQLGNSILKIFKSKFQHLGYTPHCSRLMTCQGYRNWL